MTADLPHLHDADWRETSALLALAGEDQASMDALPEAVYLCAADGRVVRFNQKAAELWGRTPRPGDPKVRFCGSLRLYRPDGALLPHDQCPVAVTLQTGESFHNQEVVIEQPSGQRVTVIVDIAALKGEDGQVIGAINRFRDTADSKQARQIQQLPVDALNQRVDNTPASVQAVDVAEQWRTEHALRDRDHILSLAEQSAGIGVWDAELATGSVRGTAQFFKIMGLPPSSEPLSQEVILALRHPEDRDRVVDGFRAAMAAGADVYETEYRIIRPDGEVRWIFGRGRVMRDSQGNPARYSGIDVDITERKEAEARLRESELRLRQALDSAQRLVAIVEASRDAIWSCNGEGIIDSWNPEAARLFQYSADEIIGQSPLTLVPPDRMESARVAIRGVLSGESYGQYETVRLRKDGTLIPVELTVSPIKGRDGEVTGIATICRDISARVRQEEALRASEARYRAAVITGRIGAWQTNMVTRTRTWTPEGMQLFGLNLPDGRGTIGGPNDEFKNALHPDDKHMMEQFHRTADQVDSYPCEYRIVHPNGRTLWVSGRGRVVARGQDGKAQLVDNMVMDVTERKKAEEQIHLLMRELAHRSKNLLAVVAAIATQTARGSARIGDFQEKFTLRLRALAASHDLLVEGGWGGAKLDQLVRQQLGAFAEYGVGFDMTGPAVTVPASVAQTLGLALHELATNAAKHGAWSTPGGTVNVRWHVSAQSERKLHVTWTEHGGPPVEVPVRKGFGHVVLEQMVAQSADGDVTIDYRPTGLQWSASLPIDSEYGGFSERHPG